MRPNTFQNIRPVNVLATMNLDKNRQKVVPIQDQKITSLKEYNPQGSLQPTLPVHFHEVQKSFLEKHFEKDHNEQVVPKTVNVPFRKIEQPMTEMNSNVIAPPAEPITETILEKIEAPVQSIINKTSSLLPTAAVISGMLGASMPEISIPVAAGLLAGSVALPLVSQAGFKVGESVEREIRNVFA